MSRISDCVFKGSGCDDPRCKRGLCILEREQGDRVLTREEAKAEEIRKEAKAVIVGMFYIKGHKKPTTDQIKGLLDNPGIVEEAKRRITERKSWSKRGSF
jgi:hypothetical protein